MKLVVVSKGTSDSNGNARWHCQCDCGNTTLSHGFSLRSGASKSCGCLTTEQLKARITKHQMARSPEYRTWASMIQRCENPKTRSYKRYGARGIIVCPRWHSFEEFFKDVGPRPSSSHSLDRVDNDGNYEPNNVRWATSKQQSQNTSRNRYIIYKGKRLSLTQAVELSTSGISRNAAIGRLNRNWSVNDALDTPPNKNIWTHIRYIARKALPKEKASG